jgi:hypothetical protein
MARRSELPYYETGVIPVCFYLRGKVAEKVWLNIAAWFTLKEVIEQIGAENTDNKLNITLESATDT